MHKIGPTTDHPTIVWPHEGVDKEARLWYNRGMENRNSVQATTTKANNWAVWDAAHRGSILHQVSDHLHNAHDQLQRGNHGEARNHMSLAHNLVREGMSWRQEGHHPLAKIEHHINEAGKHSVGGRSPSSRSHLEQALEHLHRVGQDNLKHTPGARVEVDDGTPTRKRGHVTGSGDGFIHVQHDPGEGFVSHGSYRPDKVTARSDQSPVQPVGSHPRLPQDTTHQPRR